MANPAPGATGPAAGVDVEQRARVALDELLRLGVGTKKSAGIVAGLTGLSSRRAYELGLEVKAAAEKEEEG